MSVAVEVVPDVMTVRLTIAQQVEAARVADRVATTYRQGRDATGRKARHLYVLDAVSNEERIRDSMPAELATALATHQRWHRGDRDRPDVGDRTEVRHSRKAKWLLLYRQDHVDRLFVLASGIGQTILLHGWISAQEARDDAYWRPARVAPDVWLDSWWLPDYALHPMRDFPDHGDVDEP